MGQGRTQNIGCPGLDERRRQYEFQRAEICARGGGGPFPEHVGQVLVFLGSKAESSGAIFKWLSVTLMRAGVSSATFATNKSNGRPILNSELMSLTQIN